MLTPQLAQTDPMPVHPTKVHPLTGEPLVALGFTKGGRAIWPQMGGSQPFGAPPPQQQPQTVVPPQQGGNSPGIPVLGGGHVQPGGPGLPPPGGQLPPQGQPAGQQQQGQPGGQPQGQPGGLPPGQPQVPQGQPGGQPGGQPQGQQPGQPGGQPVPTPPPVFNPPPGERGFPENTAVEQMQPPEQAAFWRFHARRNQDQLRAMADYDQIRQERDQLRQATQTEMQRAAGDAEQRGYASGQAAAASQIVEAYFRAAAANRMSDSAIEAQLATLNRAAFVNNGAVNPQQVYDHVNLIVGGQMQPAQQVPVQQPYNAGGIIPPGQPVYGPQGQPAQAYGQPVYAAAGQNPGWAAYGQPPAQPGYGQPQAQTTSNAAAFGQPQQQVPGFGQAQQQVASPGGWPQYAPVPQVPVQPNGWVAPGMPGYGQPLMRQVPDYGQGAQPSSPVAAPEAGRARAAERHGTTRSAQKQSQGNGATGARR